MDHPRRLLTELDGKKLSKQAETTPLWKLAADYGVSIGTIRSRLREAGVDKKIPTHRGGGGGRMPKRINKQELRRLVRERYSKPAIAKYFGCSVETIRARMRKLGI